jgi:hypothetical protein
METANEELSRLRAELARSKQLLDSKDAQLACKDELLSCKDKLLSTQDELLASREAELQRCQELLQRSAVPTEPDVAAADSCKRQRLHCSSTAESPLDRDDVLDDVFIFVGGGDHLYVGGVSRRWRDRYKQHCENNSESEFDGKLVTRHRSVMMTENRLKLALSRGLTVAGWTFDSWSHAGLICKHSLEPEQVMTLLRVHGVPWSVHLCSAAAFFNKLALLHWLHAHSCPWDEESVLYSASARGTIAMLDWFLTVVSPWSPRVKQRMLQAAACENTLTVVQWLRAHGADWPTSFSIINFGVKRLNMCWHIKAVQ